MTTYAAQWKTAKTKYETNTLAKKPADTIKILTRTVRIKSGVAAKLKDVDKLFPTDMSTALADRPLAKVRGAAVAATKAGLSYIAAIQKQIDKEKAIIGGKVASVLYRDLKMLRAELDAIISSIKSDLAKMEAARLAARRDIDAGMKNTFLTLRTLREGIDRNGKAALSTCQKLLKDPRPAAFNAAFPTAARDITQQLANIKKWTLPDTIGDPFLRQKRLDQLQDPKLAATVAELNDRVKHFKDQILPLLDETGNAPANASLGRMANSTLRLDDTATATDVKLAVKQFVSQVKLAMLLGRKII